MDALRQHKPARFLRRTTDAKRTWVPEELRIESRATARGMERIIVTDIRGQTVTPQQETGIRKAISASTVEDAALACAQSPTANGFLNRTKV